MHRRKQVRIVQPSAAAKENSFIIHSINTQS
jgi:hypothetical protein